MKKPPPDRDALAFVWRTKTISQICKIMGIHRRRLDYWVKKYGLDPTPKEILEYTLSLQATWSDSERERRAGRGKMVAATKAMGYDGRNMKFSEKLM